MLNKIQLIGYFGSGLALLLSLELINADRHPLFASDLPELTVTDRSPRQLLQAGIKLYEQESFREAVTVWLKSSSLFAREGDVLGEALALNNLALAYQQLGEWERSHETILQSLHLLQDREFLSEKPGYWEILAKALNTQGNWQWQTGKIELALASWQNAAKYYRQADFQLGAIKASINQAKALQTLGLTVQAVEILATVEGSLQSESDEELKATGLRYLAIGLRNLGKYEESATKLQQSATLARKTQTASLAWLELGNTQRQQYQQAGNLGRVAAGQEYWEQTMAAYQKAAASDVLSLRAQLNQLSLLVETGKYSEAKAFLKTFNFPSILAANRSNIYTLLNYARSLTCLQSSVATVPLCHPHSQSQNQLSDEGLTNIVPLIQQAIAKAQTIEDTIAETQALSQLAETYELAGNLTTAKKINQQALLLIEGTSAADLVYRLQWQLGRILEQEEDLSAAIITYSQAIASLEQVRQNILSIDPQVQFSFRDRVEPVYREYAALLLTTENNTPPSQENLQQAIKAMDALQIAELENFLGCDLSPFVRLDETTVDPTAAQIYPIILGDRLVTIVDIPGKPLAYGESKVSRSQVETTIISLQNNLAQPGKTPEVLQQARQLYQWLMAPLESFLIANSQIATLVFVPDSLLRNIPFGILYDGEQYLLEKNYAVAVSPQLELFTPSPSNAPLKVLTGGVELAQTIEEITFPAIAQVEQELTQIAAAIDTPTPPLLNEAFTETNIKQELQQGNFSAIHWKTHGVFSSDPAQTFLVAYQDSIKANELQSLVQTASQNGQKPLELIVLSACETAKGDNRAILGLAGLTIRTGARTALSTLWRADDRATALLMTKFYQKLNQPETTKAEALRQAQLSLLKEEGYFAPYYWGTYILVGNWL